MVVNTAAVQHVVPRNGISVLATVHFPTKTGYIAQDTSAILADIRYGEERANLKAHIFVGTCIPVDGLLFQWFPTCEDVPLKVVKYAGDFSPDCSPGSLLAARCRPESATASRWPVDHMCVERLSPELSSPLFSMISGRFANRPLAESGPKSLR